MKLLSKKEQEAVVKGLRHAAQEVIERLGEGYVDEPEIKR